MKRKIMALLLAAGLTVSLIGCGSGSGNTASDSGTTAGDAGTENVAQESAAVSEESGKILDNGRYEKLVVAIDEDPQDLEGDDVNVGSRYYWIYGVYESLFDFADDNSGALIPCLASEYEEEDGGATWKVTLNNDILDWDGNNITSSDVKFCFDWIIEHGQSIRFDFFKDIEVIDDYTFYMHWNEVPPAIAELEFPLTRTLIYSAKAYEDHDGMTTDPCGTGCYKVTEFTPGSKVIMEANDDYWGLNHEELTGRHKATVQTLELDVVTEASTAVIGLETGTLDVCNYVPLSMLEEFQTGNQSEKYDVEIITQGDYWLTAPNSESINADLRRAIFYSLDNATITQAMGGSYVPAETFGTNAFVDYDESLKLTGTYVTECDLDKAKEYVASSGYDGRTLKIVCVNNETSTAAATMVQLMLTQVGINAEINAVTNDIYNTITGPSHSDEWDIMLQRLGGPNMVGSWHLLFDNEVNSGKTLSLVEDAHLQDLYEAACADATHDAEHMRELLDYVVDNAIAYPMAEISTGLVYTKDISQMYYREGYFTPGAATFAK